MTKSTKNTLLWVGGAFIAWQILKPNGGSVGAGKKNPYFITLQEYLSTDHEKMMPKGSVRITKEDAYYVSKVPGGKIVSLNILNNHYTYFVYDDDYYDGVMYVLDGDGNPRARSVFYYDDGGISKPNIRYEFESNKELKEFVKNDCGPARKATRDFSLNGM